MNARDLRLRSDFESVQTLVKQSRGALDIESAVGRPPDHYVIIYRCRSIEKLNEGKPVYSNMHRVRIWLPARYPLPSAPPRLEMITPLYNPHVYPNSQVCLGKWETSEYLDELVARVGALIQLDRRILNLRDPANPEAMEWVRKNFLLLPTDTKIFGPQDISPAPTVPESFMAPDMDMNQPESLTVPESLSVPMVEAVVEDEDEMVWIDT